MKRFFVFLLGGVCSFLLFPQQNPTDPEGITIRNKDFVYTAKKMKGRILLD